MIAQASFLAGVTRNVWSFGQPPWNGYCELESRTKKDHQRHNHECQKPLASHGSNHAIGGNANARLWISNCNSTERRVYLAAWDFLRDNSVFVVLLRFGHS